MGKKNSAAASRPTMGTKIDDLPDDQDEQINAKELAVLNGILNINKSNPAEYSTMKFVMYATAIFILLSIPMIDRLFELAMPVANSWLFLIGIKAVIFFILYYIVFQMNK